MRGVVVILALPLLVQDPPDDATRKLAERAERAAGWLVDGDPELRIRLPYFRTVNFGLLDFTWEPEPRVTFTLREVRGDRVYAPLTFTPAELKNGAATWRAKMDPDELARREAAPIPVT